MASTTIDKSQNAVLIYDPKTKINYYRNTKSALPLKVDLPMISLFTGGGGLDLGLERAGFDTRAFVEKDPYCKKTITLNRPNWNLVGTGDITQITPEQILQSAGLKVREAALVAGGAPCQPFSSLGKNEGEKNFDGQLYRYFINVVREIQPAMFLFENVRGMVQNHKKVIDFMYQEFDELGYSLETALLCAADYGVPQKRYRIFLIGRRDGAPLGFPFPTHAQNPEEALNHFNNLCKENGSSFPNDPLLPWMTVRNAFNSLTADHYQREDNKIANLSPHIMRMIENIAPLSKMNWKDLPESLKFNCWKNSRFQGNDNFSRLQYDEPSVTIRTGAIYPAKGKYIHPLENRSLYTVELAALQTFPLNSEQDDGWFFCGGITSIARQIGNAVPPVLAEALGCCLKRQILSMLPSQVCRNYT